MSKKVIAAAASLLLVMANPVRGNEPGSAHELSLGLGGAFLSDHYVGDNDETALVPLMSYKTERFSIGVLEGASYDFYKSGALSLNVRATPRYTTLDDPDAQQLRGIDRKATLDAGIGVDYEFGQAYFSASAVVEVTGKHDGLEVDLNVGRVSDFGALSVVNGLGVSWRSKKLSDYQFGVRASETRHGRPAYSASATIVPYAQFTAVYEISSKWKGFAGGQLLILTGDNKSSPIVGSTEAIGFYTGIAREF